MKYTLHYCQVYEIDDNFVMNNRFKLGTTFSQKQCDYLGLDAMRVLDDLLSLDFDIYRVCAYWDQIEQTKGIREYGGIDEIIERIKNKNKRMILAFGAKVPRVPEFHFPQWVKNAYPVNNNKTAIDADPGLAEAIVSHISGVAERYKNIVKISHYQVENEALSGIDIGGGRYLSSDFLSKEVAQVRKIAPAKKIFLTNAIYLWPPLTKEDTSHFETSVALADAVGVNVYAKVPADGRYLQPNLLFWSKLRRWQKYAKEHGKETWISESQAEPWEKGSAVHIKQLKYPSSDPEQSARLASDLGKIGFDPILLWGAEHWDYWHQKGEDYWWAPMREFCNDR